MTVAKAFFTLLLFSSTTFCFELKTISEVSPIAFLKWDLSSGPIHISLDRRGSTDLNLAQAEQALVGALSSWQNVSNQSMKFQYTGTVNLQASSPTDQINSVEWVESGWDYGSHAIAVTSYSYYLDDPPTFVDADIYMNGQHYKWSVGNPDSRKVDAQQALIHEIGHLLGITHSSVAKSQMFPYMSGPPNHKISRDDKEALRFLYGPTNPSFALTTPVRAAKYVSNISTRGLPLPVFRWRPGPDTNYVIEFSKSSDFAKKIQVSCGPYPFYTLTPQMEKKLLNLSPDRRIYWRVRSGAAIASKRSFRFI